MDMDITPRQARDAIPLPQIPPSLPRRQSLPSDGSSGSLSSSGSNNGNSKGSSASTSYGSQDDDDDDGDDDDDEGPNGPIYPPLEFTCALDHIQPACKDILLSFTGGCKPYSLSAFWFHQSNQSDTTWVKLKEQTWDNTFQWNSQCYLPVSYALFFIQTDPFAHSFMQCSPRSSILFPPIHSNRCQRLNNNFRRCYKRSIK